MVGLAAFFQSLKEALTLVNETIQGVKALADFIQANKDEAWFQESAQVFKEIRNAQTPEERKAAAKKLRDSWKGI